MSSSTMEQTAGWNGLTIKEILEKVDLFNVAYENEDELKGEKVLVGKPAAPKTNKDGKTVVNASDPEAAFLGPKLWDKSISLPNLDDTEFSIMNIDDFLNENNISLDEDPMMNDGQQGSSKDNTPEPEMQQQQQQEQFQQQQQLQHQQQQQQMMQESLQQLNMLDQQQQKHSPMPSTSQTSPSHTSSSSSSNSNIQQQRQQQQHHNTSNERKRKQSQMSRQNSQPSQPKQSGNILPKDSNTDFLYVESKRARLEREREEKRRALDAELEIEFAPEDLALATVPGADFDPRQRAFSAEELRPQPIIRKRKKHYVASDSKDERYWEKRVKNNVAARRSREARRLKENQIALRAAFLEKENNGLRMQVEEVQSENEKLLADKKMLLEKIRRLEAAAAAAV